MCEPRPERPGLLGNCKASFFHASRLTQVLLQISLLCLGGIKGIKAPSIMFSVFSKRFRQIRAGYVSSCELNVPQVVSYASLERPLVEIPPPFGHEEG